MRGKKIIRFATTVYTDDEAAGDHYHQLEQQMTVVRCMLGIIMALAFASHLCWGWTASLNRLQKRSPIPVRTASPVSITSLFAEKDATLNGTYPEEIKENIPETLDEMATLAIHHVAIKTRNITISAKFYSLLGYQITEKFRAGPAKAAWLELNHGSGISRLEIIEVPDYMLREEPGTRKQCFDLIKRPELLGYNHIALDVSVQIRKQSGEFGLSDWLDGLDQKSQQEFGKKIRIALEPTQQLIGRRVYELAFIYDPDGCLVELLHHQSTLKQPMASGWEPWDGKGWKGPKIELK